MGPSRDWGLMRPQATPLLVSILTRDGLDAGPTAPGLCCPPGHPAGARDVSVPSLWGPGWRLSHWYLGDAADPVSPPGLRCTFRSLPAFLVGLVRSRLVTCGQGVCRQHWSEIQVRMFPRVWTNDPWEVWRECCLASCLEYLQANSGGSLRPPFSRLHGVSPRALLRAEVLPLHRQQAESLRGAAWFSRKRAQQPEQAPPSRLFEVG